jgi:hypothetical protein
MVVIVRIAQQLVVICGDMRYHGQLKDITSNLLEVSSGTEETIGKKSTSIYPIVQEREFSTQ